VIVLDPERWSAWLAGANEAELLIQSPAGSIAVERMTEQA
jgi:putative SOS response-associated peptidase YedK